MTLILRLFFNIIAVWIATAVVPGFMIGGGAREYVAAGIVLGLLNLVVKPIIKFFSTPLILLTLGLFTFVINAIILLAVDYLLYFVTIETIGALVIATFIIGVINIVAGAGIKSLHNTHSHAEV